MSRDFTAVANKILYPSIQSGQGQAQTFSCWVYIDVANATRYFFNIHTDGVPETLGVIVYHTSDGSIQFLAVTDDVDCKRTTVNGAASTGAWFHLLCTWDGSLTAANIHILKNGSELGYEATQNGVGSFAACEGTWTFGAATFNDLAFDGKLANVGWWNRVLSAGEIALLVDGFSPSNILNGLKFAPDLVRDPRDIISGQAGTLTGTAVYPHPRVIVPSSVYIPRYPYIGDILSASADIIISTTANVHEEAALSSSADVGIITGAAVKSEQTLSMDASVSIITEVDVHEEAKLAGDIAIEIATVINVTLGYVYLIAGSASVVFNTAINDMKMDMSLSPSADVVFSTALDTVQTSLLAVAADIVIATEADVHEVAITGGSADIVTTTQAAIWRWLDFLPAELEESMIDPYSGGAYLWAVEIAIPGYDTDYLAKDKKDITYAENTYTANNLQVKLAALIADGSVPRDMVKVAQDPDHTLEDKINATEGAGGGTVRIIRIHENYLADHIVPLERNVRILVADSDTDFIVIQLGIPDPLIKKVPLRRGSSKVCPYAVPELFKGVECQYAGEDGTCTGLLSDCKDKDNAEHWGGDLGLDPSVTRV